MHANSDNPNFNSKIQKISNENDLGFSITDDFKNKESNLTFSMGVVNKKLILF